MRASPRFVYEWGTSAVERDEGRPCDGCAALPAPVLLRARAGSSPDPARLDG